MNGSAGMETSAMAGPQIFRPQLGKPAHRFLSLVIDYRHMEAADNTANTIVVTNLPRIFGNVIDAGMTAARDDGQAVLTTIHKCAVVYQIVWLPLTVHQAFAKRCFIFIIVAAGDLPEEYQPLTQLQRFRRSSKSSAACSRVYGAPISSPPSRLRSKIRECP